MSFSSSDPLASLPGPYTFTPSDAGAHTFASAVALFTTGPQSITAADGAISGTEADIFVADSVAPTWPPGSALSAIATSTTSAHLSWTPASDNVGVTSYRLYRNGMVDQTLPGSVLAADVAGLVVGVPAFFQVEAGDAAGNSTGDGPTAVVTTVPPDPVTVAPPVDPSLPTTVFDSTAFLYSGTNPIQAGVGSGDFKVAGQWERDALHFHLGPEELMKWHLPQEAYPWWRNLLSILRR